VATIAVSPPYMYSTGSDGGGVDPAGAGGGDDDEHLAVEGARALQFAHGQGGRSVALGAESSRRRPGRPLRRANAELLQLLRRRARRR
jgi:hypothetical protein